MPALSHLPALKLLAGYTAGCVAALLLPDCTSVLLIAVPAAGALGAAVLRSCAPLFWATLVLIGVWTGNSAAGLPLRIDNPPASELPAVVWGKIERILNRDSTAVRCLVRGTVDSRPMKPHTNTGLVLTVVRPDSTALKFLQAGNSIAASAQVRLPRPASIPGEFNERVYYTSLGVEWVGTASGKSVALVDENTDVNTFVQRAGEAVNSELCRLFPERTEGMAIALVTGDRSLLAQHTKQAFMLTGTAHVLAVSGLHVGILAAIVLLPLSGIKRPAMRVSLFTVALLAYTFFTGMQPSMLRAAIMAVLTMLIANAQREINLLNILCFTVVVMLVCDPHLLFSIGFYLSAVSLVGIAVLYPAVHRTLGLFLTSVRRPVRFIHSSLAMTLAASAAVSPVAAYSFSVFSVVSPLANLFAIPLTSIGMVYALCALAAAQMSDWLGSLFAHTADALLYIAELLNTGVAALPAAAVSGAMALPLALCCSAATLYVALAQTKRVAIFRMMCSAVGTVLLLALLYSNERNVEVIPREQLVAVVIPLTNNRTLAVLHDRRADAYPKRDLGLERLINSHPRVTLIACGAASLRCAASLRSTSVDAVIAQTLALKNRAIWAALDSLDARKIRVVNASCFWEERQQVVLQSGQVSFVWDAWHNSVSLRSGAEVCSVVLPRVVSALRLPGNN